MVCDRFVDSSIAYQGGGRRLGSSVVAAINRLAVGDTLPDITVYLRMNPEKALSRRLSASEPDRLESEKNSFFDRTYQAYEALYGEAGMERVASVDASQSIEDVTRDMLSVVDEKLNALSV